MIKKITVINYLNQRIDLTLAEPGDTGFAITKITGLGPVTATINTQDTYLNGSIYKSSRIQSRNIVISITFEETDTESIEDVRNKSYKYFSVGRKVKLIIYTDSKTVETEGYVESNEPDIFSSAECTDISIVCPCPFFKVMSPDIYKNSSDYEINIFNPGDVAVGALFTVGLNKQKFTSLTFSNLYSEYGVDKADYMTIMPMLSYTKTAITPGYYFRSGGELEPIGGYGVTSTYTPVTPGTRLTMYTTQTRSDGEGQPNNCFYKSDKTFLSSVQWNKFPTQDVVVPADAAYMRITYVINETRYTYVKEKDADSITTDDLINFSDYGIFKDVVTVGTSDSHRFFTSSKLNTGETILDHMFEESEQYNGMTLSKSSKWILIHPGQNTLTCIGHCTDGTNRLMDFNIKYFSMFTGV